MEEIDRSIPFVETHHHLWDLKRFQYEWLSDPGLPGHNARLGDYRMIRSSIGEPWRFYREFYGANVIKSVFVETDISGDSLIETSWVDQVAQEVGLPNGVIVYCDLASDDAEAQLDAHLEASRLVRGVRMRAHPANPGAAFRRGYSALAARGISYDLNVSPGDILAGRTMAAANPDVQVVIGHAGFPLQRDREYFHRWRTEMSALAEVEHVACKVSGLGMVDHRWSVESIRPWILACVEAFGPARIMFGTNWPVDALFSTYLEQTDAYRLILAEAGFSHAEQEAMLWRNAERLYRI